MSATILKMSPNTVLQNYTERAENYKSENVDAALYINSLKVGRSIPMVGDSVINFFQSCNQVVPFNSFHGCFTTVPNFLKRIHALFKYSKISDFFLIQIKRSLFVINGNCRTLLCHLFKEINKQFCTLCLLSPGHGHQSFHQISIVYECLICETQPDSTDGTCSKNGIPHLWSNVQLLRAVQNTFLHHFRPGLPELQIAAKKLISPIFGYPITEDLPKRDKFSFKHTLAFAN